MFTIYVNNDPFETDSDHLTGSEIKALAAVPADYELFEAQAEEVVPVPDDEVVEIHDGLHFRAIPAGTFGLR